MPKYINANKFELLNLEALFNSTNIKKGNEINAAKIVTQVVNVIVSICFKLYANILDKTYPRAAHIIAILGIKLLCDILKLIIESKPKIKITPNKPMIMEINFIIVNLSSFVIK